MLRRSVSRPWLALIASVLLLAASSNAVACMWCDYSPNGWGFCKGGGMSGYGQCVTVVRDAWSGRTGCDTWGECYNGGDVNWYSQSACNWTDVRIEYLV